VGVGFLLIKKKALIEPIFLPLMHDVLVKKKLPIISVLMAIKFLKDITMFHRLINICKKSFRVIHHFELDFIYV